MEKKLKNSKILSGILICAAILLAAGYFIAIRRIGWGTDTGTAAAVEEPAVSELRIPEEELQNGYLEITEMDRQSLPGRYKLPGLSRMPAEDQNNLMGGIQVLRRVEALGLNAGLWEFPEARYKLTYNRVMMELDTFVPEGEIIFFAGTKVSELNRMLQENEGRKIQVRSQEILADETLRVPSGVCVDGGGVRIVPVSEGQDKAIVLDRVSNVQLSGFAVEEGFNYGIYVKYSENFCLENNRISDMQAKGMALMGDNHCFRISENIVKQNLLGGVYIDGDAFDGIIERNIISDNYGANNMSAGLVICPVEILDEETVNNPGGDRYLYDIIEAPHELVVMDNTIAGNNSSGCYSFGGYSNYYIQNNISDNEKEGMCLDHGSLGNYVAFNMILGNGGRFRMTDADLEMDFISELGRLEDGSSPAKLPGVSLDNTAYNTLYNNIVAKNYGSGIKAVRSSYRNIILCNEVTDNNVGASEVFHFFGIELATDMNADQAVKGLDFTPNYENIIARNTISGKHFSGVFYGVNSYIDDCFDNTVMGATDWCFESLSSKFNSVINNMSDKPNRIAD